VVGLRRELDQTGLAGCDLRPHARHLGRERLVVKLGEASGSTAVRWWG